MIPFFVGSLTCLGAFFRSRYSLGLEILALRQQLGIPKRKHPRPRLRMRDRIFWILLRRLWPAWRNILVIVKPETVVAWHRAGFRLFWRLRSWPFVERQGSIIATNEEQPENLFVFAPVNRSHTEGLMFEASRLAHNSGFRTGLL
jgi:hypothetical protein